MKTPAFVLMVAALLGDIICFSAMTGGQQSVASSSAIEGSLTDDKLSLPPEFPEAILGDRLFFESRFSQFFFTHCKGDVNARLTEGDALVNGVPVKGRISLPGPFRGQSMNCRQCHLGDDFLSGLPLAARTYCDFSQRSPIPQRDDGLTKTVRNAQLMINLGLPREVPVLFHFDGEFSSVDDLVIDTLTGRNFGWLPQEAPVAISHIAKIIRDDHGINPRYARDPYGKGVPYRMTMLGTDSSLPGYLRIPAHYRIDVTEATDDQILQTVAKLIQAYMNSLRFGTRNTRRQSGSPYDLFLEKNRLPASPNKEESEIAYTKRLRTLIEQPVHFEWVTSADGMFQLHSQRYQFGPSELQGLKIFLASADNSRQTQAGNCAACHTPPQFTDYRFHNNGVSQVEYDTIFGQGAFVALEVPGLAVRNAAFNTYMPASSKHPHASSRFRSAPLAGKPGYADLGVWNILGNPDLPKPQESLTKILCEPLGHITKPCSPEKALPSTIAQFKTPSIRDLGHSDPYFHSGAVDAIEDVLRFYIST